MNIQERIEKIEDLKFEYENTISRESYLLKKDFESYITDPNIAFKDRWNTFIHSPNELSNFLNRFAYFKLNDLPEEQSWVMDKIENELFENNMDYGKNVDLKEMYGQYFTEDGEVDFDNVRWDIRFGDYSDEDLKFFVMKTAEIILKCNVYGFDPQLDLPHFRQNKSISFEEYQLNKK